jgi:hypothetical protein
MPCVGFEPMIPTPKRAKRVHALGWVLIARGYSCAGNSFVCLPCSCPVWKRGSRVWLLLRSREITMNTARAAAAFVFMFNIIEGKKKQK